MADVNDNRRFGKESGTYTCRCCGKRTRQTNKYGDGRDPAAIQLCDYCYWFSGWENAHSDNDHDTNLDPHCPICQVAAGFTREQVEAHHSLLKADACGPDCLICEYLRTGKLPELPPHAMEDEEAAALPTMLPDSCQPGEQLQEAWAEREASHPTLPTKRRYEIHGADGSLVGVLEDAVRFVDDDRSETGARPEVEYLGRWVPLYSSATNTWATAAEINGDTVLYCLAEEWKSRMRYWWYTGGSHHALIGPDNEPVIKVLTVDEGGLATDEQRQEVANLLTAGLQTAEAVKALDALTGRVKAMARALRNKGLGGWVNEWLGDGIIQDADIALDKVETPPR